jgi:hypothetical protein
MMKIVNSFNNKIIYYLKLHFTFKILKANFGLIFPIFRGSGLLISYMFLYGWNVYCWKLFKINYKLIFNFNNHYSDYY